MTCSDGPCTVAALTEMLYLQLSEAPPPCTGPDRIRYVSLQAVLIMSINIDLESLRLCAGGHHMVLLQPVKLNMCKDALYAPMHMQTPGAASVVLSHRHQSDVSTPTVSAATVGPFDMNSSAVHPPA